MNKPRIPRTPARSLAAVAAATLALLAGWAVFRVAGRGALDARLQNRQGDPAALQGFTLLGQVQHLNADAVTTFTLEDGEFCSETRLDTNTLAGATNWDYQLYNGTNWTIDPADRAAVNAAAVPDGDTLTSTAPPPGVDGDPFPARRHRGPLSDSHLVRRDPCDRLLGPGG